MVKKANVTRAREQQAMTRTVFPQPAMSGGISQDETDRAGLAGTDQFSPGGKQSLAAR